MTDLPGTTRDLLRQQVHLDGLPVNIIDTAGLRAAADIVEEEGIRRAKVEMQRADRVLYVVDAATTGPGTLPMDLPAQAAELPPGVPVTWVVNKIDLLGQPASIATDDDGATRILLSARSGEGLDLLRDHLKTMAGYGSAETGAFSARRRHLDALSRANLLVTNGAATLRSTRAFELFAEDLRLAQRALSDITGEITSDDLLGEIFGSFCIGK